jgi:hypothetical protein
MYLIREYTAVELPRCSMLGLEADACVFSIEIVKFEG